IFAPFIILFPLYFVSFITLLITSGMRLIKREGKKLHNFLSITLGAFLFVWAIVAPFLTVTELVHPIWLVIYFIITIFVYYFFFIVLIIVAPFLTITEGTLTILLEIYFVITFIVYYCFFLLLLFVVSSFLYRIPLLFKT